MRPGRRGRVDGLASYLAAAVLAGAVLFGAVPAASADLTFCFPGSAPGECEFPEGVAVNRETELFYVADRDNDRIQVFNAEGAFQFFFGEVQLNHPIRIAIDNSGGPSQGAVYVIDQSFRVLKFKANGEFVKAFSERGNGECQISGGLTRPAIAVGPGGIVHVADTKLLGKTSSEGFATRIEKFDEGGVCLEEISLFEERPSVAGLAVDSNGDIYLTDIGGGAGIRKFDSSGVEYGAPYPLDPDLEVGALGVDGGDNLFASQREDTFRMLAEYDEAGDTLRRFGYGSIQARPAGIAPFSSSFGDVLAGEIELGSSIGLNYLEFPPPGPIVVPSTVKANPVSNTKATLNARINPEGKATDYHFEYVDDATFKASGFTTAKKTAVKPLATSPGTVFRLNAVSEQVGCLNPATEAAEGKCLEPDTLYHFRVIAKNTDGEDEGEGTFETKPPLEFETYATDVGVDTATLAAKLNSLGIPATGHFEYVDDATFQASGFAAAKRVPVAGQIDFGAGEAPVIRSATVSLAPGTTYHYRLVAEDFFITLEGEPQTIRTFAPLAPGQDGPCPNDAFRTDAGAFLVDCRAYEMVSPLDKNDGDIVAPIEVFTELPAALNRSSLTGERLTYSSFQAFGGALSAPYSSQYIAHRNPPGSSGEGWQTHPIVSPHGAPVLTPGKQTDTEFKAFSPDLCSVWFRTTSEPVLAEGAIARYPNLYRRTDEECGGPAFEALTTVQPEHETSESPYAGQNYGSLELEGLSGDGATALYAVNETLASNPPAQPQPLACKNDIKQGDECIQRLYLRSADGALHYVCVPPLGEVPKTGCSAGGPADNTGSHRENRIDNAISTEGSRVFFTSYASGVGPGRIYVRENPAAEGEPCADVASPCTIAVSKEAEALSKTSASQYWGAAEDGSKAIFTTGGDLYEFEVDSKTTNPIAGEVAGLLGMSEDASLIYFVSEEDLDGPGEALAGGQNLYLYRSGPGSTRFVGELAQEDIKLASLNSLSPVGYEPRRHLSRVSADGQQALFMSLGSPTGYDNKDARNEKAAAEVYLYDAGAGKLLCVSCNPGGARPIGANFAVKPGEEYWAAGAIQRPQNTLYSARVLSDNGKRVYFTSSDTLSPRDTNGVRDVYQWEAQGTGGCGSADPGFVPASGGCLSLVSTGKSANPSEFVDASPSGEDVFISTLSGLVPQDYGLVDIYDARVGGGFPAPPPQKLPCEGEACQSPPAPPQAPTPSSSVYQGPGNVSEAKKKRCAKGRRRVTRKGKAHCVKAKKHKQRRKAPRGRAQG